MCESCRSADYDKSPTIFCLWIRYCMQLVCVEFLRLFVSDMAGLLLGLSTSVRWACFATHQVSTVVTTRDSHPTHSSTCVAVAYSRTACWDTHAPRRRGSSLRNATFSLVIASMLRQNMRFVESWDGVLDI